MLRFFDGFDHYDTTRINQKWTNSAGVVIAAGAGRFGGNAMQINDTGLGGFLQKTLDAQNLWVVGFAVRPSGFPSTNTPILKFYDGQSVQLDLRVNFDGTLSLTRNGAPLAGGTSVFSLQVGGWYFIEVKVKFSNAIAAGDCQVMVNNSLVIDVTAGQDCQETANSTANSIWLSGTAPTCAFDDPYICDGVGPLCNNFLGDSRIFTIMPNGVGDVTQFAVTGATFNWQAVNSVPPAGDTKYVSSSTPGQRDLYNLADPVLTGSIWGIQTNLYARKDDSGARTMAAVVKTIGVEYDGLAFYPSTGYLFHTEVRQVNPNTAVPWLPAEIIALQAGPKIIS